MILTLELFKGCGWDSSEHGDLPDEVTTHMSFFLRKAGGEPLTTHMTLPMHSSING